MENAPPETRFFDSFDGARLAWREMGEGHPVLLLHGFFSDAYTNWIRYGHAARIAEHGFRVIMPDLRAHGESAKPHDAESYPPDVLSRDAATFIEHLGLTDYDLGGYSLGARTVVRRLVQGATPRRAVIAGMGFEGLTGATARAAHFRHILTNLGQHERGSPEWLAEAFLKTTKGDPVALLRIIDTFVDTTAAEIAGIRQPALVLSGIEDDDNGSASALAAALPDAVYRNTPGGHMSAVVKPELGEAIADFLAG